MKFNNRANQTIIENLYLKNILRLFFYCICDEVCMHKNHTQLVDKFAKK